MLDFLVMARVSVVWSMPGGVWELAGRSFGDYARQWRSGKSARRLIAGFLIASHGAHDGLRVLTFGASVTPRAASRSRQSCSKVTVFAPVQAPSAPCTTTRAKYSSGGRSLYTRSVLARLTSTTGVTRSNVTFAGHDGFQRRDLGVRPRQPHVDRVDVELIKRAQPPRRGTSNRLDRLPPPHGRLRRRNPELRQPRVCRGLLSLVGEFCMI